MFLLSYHFSEVLVLNPKDASKTIWWKIDVLQFKNQVKSIRVRSFFTFYDKLTKMWRLGLNYKYKCGGCNVTFYLKTKLHFIFRICKHLEISHFTVKQVKIDKNKLTAIQEHLFFWNYSPSFEDFSFLAVESNDVNFNRESLIELGKLMHNKKDTSIPLELFW